MFKYWEGYEIDGSSTAYNVIVPERQLIAEILQCFLNLKIIDRRAEIELREDESRRQDFTWEELNNLCEKVANTEAKTIELSAGCIHPDQLFSQVRREVYALTPTRPGAEGKSYPYQKPTVSPLYPPALGVSFSISFKNQTDEVKDYQPEGLVFNERALVSKMAEPHFTIELACGPGFIYEYAAYIMTKLAARFPEIGIDGGIDCAGGFVDGCTYASNLYEYERITVSACTHARVGELALPLQRLMDSKVIIPAARSGKYGRDLVLALKLSLYNTFGLDKAKDEYLDTAAKIVKGIAAGKNDFSTAEYGELVRKIAAVDVLREGEFTFYCICGVFFQEKAVAITCVKEENEIFLEARVPAALRGEFVKQMRLVGLDD
jgi:hypothetical protein